MKECAFSSLLNEKLNFWINIWNIHTTKGSIRNKMKIEMYAGWNSKKKWAEPYFYIEHNVNINLQNQNMVESLIMVDDSYPPS